MSPLQSFKKKAGDANNLRNAFFTSKLSKIIGRKQVTNYTRRFILIKKSRGVSRLELYRVLDKIFFSAVKAPVSA